MLIKAPWRTGAKNRFPFHRSRTMNIAMTMNAGLTYHDSLRADDGYTLICPKYSRDMWLIDICGRIVNRWTMPYLPAGHGILMPNGNLLYGGQFKTHRELGLPSEFSALGGIVMEVDWSGKVQRSVEIPLQHHDFILTDEGHIICPAQQREGMLPDEYASRLVGGLPGTEFEGKVWGDTVVEVDNRGEVVWRWLAFEHLDPEIDFLCPLETRAKWPVINSIWLCRDGDLLLSLRVASEVVKVDRPTGRVVARYGKGEIFHQHDARELENGNILVFDNGNHRPQRGPSYSRVVEFDSVSGKIVWQYTGSPPSDFFSAVAGGSERLQNGNTFICESLTGRLFEVTGDGEIVWEYVSPFQPRGLGKYTNFAWRAHRYPFNYDGFKGRDLNPGKFAWENRILGSYGSDPCGCRPKC
jgi:hypothetical protein